MPEEGRHTWREWCQLGLDPASDRGKSSRYPRTDTVGLQERFCSHLLFPYSMSPREISGQDQPHQALGINHRDVASVQCVCPLMPSCNTYRLTWVSHTLGVGYLFTAVSAKCSHCSLPWTRSISSSLLNYRSFNNTGVHLALGVRQRCFGGEIGAGAPSYHGR